ncbi:MAG: SusC/RagA family TonB-linked outer membrane protein [Gemmatimonadetes bacterium]|nr:SusC/RagA family TonB-linked outer membrane protein [Gemmatimonadota bacterium]
MRPVVTARTLLAMLVLAGSLAAAPPAGAQDTGRITGIVRERETARPLAGAQVFLQGTRMGGLTNADGRYLILSVPPGTHEVRVTVIGFTTGTATVTVTAGQTANADFSLTETAVALEGIVVTGTAAEVRAREVGNTIDAVTAHELENIPVTNPENILAGRIPGVTVMEGSGQPGAGNTIRIRQQVTVSATQEPLIYVDGVRIFSDMVGTQGGARLGLSPLQDIAAEDIDRIEVLKGAAAATLYGTEAAAGIIQIFTKRGVAGTPIWSGEVTAGFNDQPPLNMGNDPWQLFTKCGGQMTGISMSRSTFGQDVKFMDPTCPSSGSWFKKGGLQRYNLSVRGGAGNVTYFVSGNYNDEYGTLQTQQARTGGMRANFDFAPHEGVKIQVNTAYSIRSLSFVEDGNSASGFLLNVGRGFSGNFKGGKGEDCAAVPSDVTCVTNQYLFDTQNLTRTDRFTGGLTIQHDASQSLTNRLSFGWDWDYIHNKWIRPWGGLRVPLGTYNDAQTTHSKLTIDYAGSWLHSFGAGKQYQSTFSWGGQIFRDNHRWLEVYTSNFAGPGVPTLESGSLWDPPSDYPFAETNAGVFVQELVGWKDRLFLTGGLRVDGNSAFGENFGLQAYPKASLAYVISDESFWPTSWWETMKLRGAFGFSGKAPGVFDKLRTWSPVSADEGTPGFTPNDVGNPDVGPERTREIEAGFDASLWQGLLGVEATYFDTRTMDALVGVLLPPSNGFLARRTENVGTLKSSGTEFQITAALLRLANVEWRVRANMSFQSSDAVDLNCHQVEGQATPSCEQISADNKAYIRVGYAVPTYWGYRVTNPNAHAAPIESDTMEAIGPVYPTTLLGFGTTVSLGRRLTMDALMEFHGGNYLPNYTGYQNSRRGVWYACYDIQRAMAQAYNTGDESVLAPYTALQRARCATNALGGHNSDFWVDKADFWKLRSVSLAYELPEAWVARYASRATLTLAARNLFTWTDFVGTDPEVEDFTDRAGQVSEGAGEYGRREYYNLPPSRSFLLTLRVTF